MTMTLGHDDAYRDPSLTSIRPDDASAYLLSRGWRQIRQLRRLVQWVAPGEEGYQVLAPLDADSEIFASAIRKLIMDLSAVEDRSAGSVLRDLLAVRADTIRVRVQPRGDGDGASIPLDDGAKLVDHSRKLLVAAARSADKRQKSFSGGALPGPVSQYLKRARLGQTERGSYVVAITVPVNAPPGQGALFVEEDMRPPFPWRVTRTLASATRAARDTAEAVAEQDAHLNRFRDVVEQGVSANLCESLAGIGGAQEGGFTISLAWAPIRQEPERETTVEFSDHHIPVLKDAAVLLRYVDEGPFVLQGRVKGLDEAREHGPWQISVEPVGGEHSEVWVHLDRDTYRQASRAQDDRQRVRLRGRLVRERSRWELVDPHDFTVLAR